jgi:hypothetical protein
VGYFQQKGPNRDTEEHQGEVEMTNQPLPIKPLSESMDLPEILAADLELRPIQGVLAIGLRTGTYAQGVDEKDAVDKLKLQIKRLGYGKPGPEKCTVIQFLEEISDNLWAVSRQKGAEAQVYESPWVAGSLSARAEETAFAIAAYRVEHLTRDLAPKFMAKTPHCDCGRLAPENTKK